MADTGKPKSTRGSAMLEFTLTTIPLVFVILSVASMAITMWNYHTLAQAVKATVREAAVHGADCVGQSCAWTLGTAATLLENKALGIPPTRLNATFTSSGSTRTCNPLTSCTGSSSAWPTLAANTAGNTDVSITVTYTPSEAMSMVTPSGTAGFSLVSLSAKSQQMVEY